MLGQIDLMIILPAFLAGLLVLATHIPLGAQVLKRGIVFIDLAIAQIARRLYISESTAKTHVANIYEKLGAGNRAQAVMAAVRLGLVGDEKKAPR